MTREQPSVTPASTDDRWRRARNVLAVRLDNLGDIIMTGPALQAIGQSAPGTQVTLLTSASGAAALKHLPMLAGVIRYDAPWVKGPEGAEFDDAAMIELLRERRFDAAVIFTVCTQSALPAAFMLRLAGIPLRAAHCRENPYALLSDWVPDREVIADGMRHEVQRQLDLVRSLGFQSHDDRLVFQYDHVARDTLKRKLAAAGVAEGMAYFVVHPGATAESRRYPAIGFQQAAQAIASRTGAIPIFIGASSEQAIVNEARGIQRIGVSMAGQLDLGELAALIDGAQVMVCNNSGPAHIAAARGTPTVVLYALTNPQHTPWRVPSVVLNVDVPCRNCLKSVCPMQHHDCLRRVPPSAIVDAALALMSRQAARQPSEVAA